MDPRRIERGTVIVNTIQNFPLARWRAQRSIIPTVTLLIAISIALVPMVPILWVLFTALKERGRVIVDPLALPKGTWHWDNFVVAWVQGGFSKYFGNSLIVSLATVLLILVLALLAAYSFARINFVGKRVLFITFLLGLTIPLSVLIIPLFYLIRNLNLINSPWSLILPQVAKQLPFAILLLYSFIRQLPREIMDAGLIDGCSHRHLLSHIVLPLTRPALLTLLVFNFMWSWNQFLLPWVLIHEDAARTLPVGLNNFQGRYVTDVPLLMAGTTITFMPVILIYLIFQRHFIRGVTAGALK